MVGFKTTVSLILCFGFVVLLQLNFSSNKLIKINMESDMAIVRSIRMGLNVKQHITKSKSNIYCTTNQYLLMSIFCFF